MHACGTVGIDRRVYVYVHLQMDLYGPVKVSDCIWTLGK